MTKGLATAAKRPKPVLPVVAPEVMRPAPGDTPWQVRQGTGSVNLSDGVMNVPLEDTPEARHVRIHELLHARVTPEDLLQVGGERGASWQALQGCEDGRLGKVATAQGIAAYTDTAPIPPERFAGMLATSWGIGVDPVPGQDPDYHGGACLAAASYGTALWPIVADALDQIPPAAVAMRHAVKKYLGDAVEALDPGNPESTITAARILDHLLPEPEEGEGEEDGRGNDQAMSGDVNQDAGPRDENGCESDPENVHVHRFALPVKAAAPPSRARRRSRDAGALTRPSEALSPLGDGQPFRRRAKAPGGIVVIDVSGSMHPVHEEVQALVSAAPGAMIICYSSKSNDAGQVILYVVGERGRVCTPQDLAGCIGGANMNDASVLAWAVKNGPEGPRVWVSDGCSGNAKGKISAGSITYTKRVAKRLGFLQVPSVSDALA